MTKSVNEDQCSIFKVLLFSDAKETLTVDLSARILFCDDFAYPYTQDFYTTQDFCIWLSLFFFSSELSYR